MIYINEAGSLVVRGIELTREQGMLGPGGYMTIYDDFIFKKVCEYSFSDISEEIAFIRYLAKGKEFGLNEFISDIVVQVYDNSGIYGESGGLEFRFDFKWDLWKNSWSISEYIELMNDFISDSKYNAAWINEKEEHYHAVTFDIFDVNQTIQFFMDEAVTYLKEIENKILSILHSRVKQDTAVVRLFDFPEHVRVPCEQYLVYFSQFLEELGIEATSDIHHEAGNVLFSVTPASKSTALEQIARALDIYLQLPVHTPPYMQVQTNPREQQLIANIQHLNGQLMLVNALAQSKEEMIQNQRSVIYQQQKFIDATILQKSVVSVDGVDEEREELLGGAVAVTKYEGNGFEINLPNIYREIKKMIGK
ncbi:hypothetical protein J2Z48_003117 [Croceifilum oryzae]|uniref:Uncharacterized protein n=1 Tax=Croceifilum oryzae TaxID=1553429 RepID=A0AAJ1TL65_9BACL|nr:hypothetical protein [Croceifilum oryzae]MDQ0418912.1 hypothetical protein [Croceifilum oryzae]